MIYVFAVAVLGGLLGAFLLGQQILLGHPLPEQAMTAVVGIACAAIPYYFAMSLRAAMSDSREVLETLKVHTRLLAEMANAATPSTSNEREPG